MSNLLIQNNNQFYLAELTASHEKLPIGNYLLCFNESTNQYFLKKQEDFAVPKVIYGDYSYVNRWKKSFENTEKNLGVLLSGYKGNGKTLVARNFCNTVQAPVIFITTGYSGVEFEAFITNPIFNGCIIFIDEYEKIYNEDRDNIDVLLSIMDGLYNTHLLFLLTVNDSRLMSDKLKNRLGRVKYHKTFNTLDKSVIDGVVEDLLINKDYKQSLFEVIEFIPTISFDILTTLINEMNLFDEPATTCVKHLNLVKEEVYYDIHISNGKVTRIAQPDYTTLPDGMIEIYIYDGYEKKEDEEWPKGRIYLKDYKLKNVNEGFSFKYDEDYEIFLYPKDISSLLF